MPSTLRRIDDPHDATIAPDIIPADWASHAPQAPANDAISREKLFAEIRHAAETAAPAVDNTFRATDVNDIPARKKKSRAWIKSAATAFVFALISAFGAAAWKHHGDAATEAAASWVPLLGASSSQAGDTSGADQQTADAAAQPATDQPADAAQPTSSAAALPPEAEQQIRSMARDLAAMGQQIEQLKATIEALKANQQTATAAPPPVARAPAPKPKVSALPPRPPAPPPAYPPRPAYSPAVQASAAPPPVAAAPPPQAYPAPPPAYAPPLQATVQPNGEPIVRPPMPMPLSDRY
jgi:hypothetical protein